VLTQSQIAKKLDLNATSTYRYINTLVEMGFLDKSTRTKEIRPSIRSLFLFTNLMRATDHLRVIKELVDRISIENRMSVDVTLAMDDSW
jgi:DNA-binding IclR family transcriptional regulator